MLGFQEAVSVRPIYLECNGLEAGFITFKDVKHFDLEMMGLSPSRIHAVKHGCPVHGLRSAGTRMQRHNGIAVVVLTGQESLHADGFKPFLKALKHGLDLRNHGRIRLFIRHLDHFPDVVPVSSKLFVAAHIFFQGRQFLHFLLCLARFIPDGGLFHFLI